MDNLSQYINSIARYPLLTKTQEIMLGRQVREWLDTEEPTPQQVRVGKRAYEKLINCNLRIVVSIAKKYMPRARRTEMLDVIQEGNIGLAHGIKKFDPERGYALSTYIYWWVRQGITRHLNYHDRMIRLPCNGVDLLNKLRYWLPQFQQEHGRMPTQDEYAEYLEVSKDRVNDYLRHVYDCASLDQKARTQTDDGSTLLELLPDQREHPMQSLEWAIGIGALDVLLERLSPEDQQMLKMYYGMDGYKTHTLAEIGRTFGVSRERIRQRHNKSMLKLRILSTGASVKEICK